jgi:threonine/homoserine/homoserine lactone efflux protein
MYFDVELFVTIISVYLIIVISPGPNFVLVTQYSLRYATSLAFATVLGLAMGAAINASITIFGVGAVIVSYPFFGFLVSVFGGCIMGYLGGKVIILAFQERDISKAKNLISVISTDKQSNFEGLIQDETYASALCQGLLVNLLNPKGIVFFISLYAPLISKASLVTKGAVLGVSFLIEIVWYGIVILILSRQKFRNYYTQSSFFIDCLLGIILILIGARILFQSQTYL